MVGIYPRRPPTYHRGALDLIETPSQHGTPQIPPTFGVPLWESLYLQLVYGCFVVGLEHTYRWGRAERKSVHLLEFCTVATTHDQYIELEECGCCDCYHRPGFHGDCRNDAERFPTWQVYVGLHNGREAFLIDEGEPGELFRYI